MPLVYLSVPKEARSAELEKEIVPLPRALVLPRAIVPAKIAVPPE